MKRREFIQILGATLAAGATIPQAFAQAAKQGARFEKARHCGECEHFIHGGWQSSGSSQREQHWCDHYQKWMGHTEPHRLLACGKGIKLVED